MADPFTFDEVAEDAEQEELQPWGLDEAYGLSAGEKAGAVGLAAGTSWLQGVAPRLTRTLGVIAEAMPPVSAGPGMAYVPPVLQQEHERRMTRTPGQFAAEAAENPIVQATNVAEEYWKEKIQRTEAEKNYWLARGTEEAVAFIPYAMAGPGAAGLIAAETAADHIINDFEEYKKNFGEEEAGKLALERALTAGALQGAVFHYLPKPLRAAGERFIVAKFGESALPKFLGKRAASMAQTTGLFEASNLAENLASGRAPFEGAKETAVGGLIFGGLTPYGLTARERSGAAERPSRPPVEEDRWNELLKLTEEELKSTGYKYQTLDGDIEGKPRLVAETLEDGTIVVSKPKLRLWIDKYIADGINPEDAIKKAVAHESVHSATWLLEGGRDKAEGFFNDFSGVEKFALRRIIPNGQKLSSLTMGQESIRYMLEKASGAPSELIATAKYAGLTKQSMDKLLDVTFWIRKNIGKTEASQRQLELLDVIDTNIKIARTTIEKGEQDASQVTGPTSVPELEVRPPVGQEAPLRQPGQAAKTQAQRRVAEEAQVPLTEAAPAVAPEKKVELPQDAPARGEILVASTEGGFVTNKREFVPEELGLKIAARTKQDISKLKKAEKAPPTAQPGEAPLAAPAEGAAKPTEPVKPAVVEPAISQPTLTPPQAQVKGPARAAYEAHLNSMRGVKRTGPQMKQMRQLLKAAEKEDAAARAASGGSDVTLPALEMEGGDRKKIDELVSRRPGEMTFEEFMSLKDGDMKELFERFRQNNKSAQFDSPLSGEKMSPEQLPKVIEARDKANKAMLDAMVAGDYDGSFPHQARVIWLNGLIEGIKKSGPNYLSAKQLESEGAWDRAQAASKEWKDKQKPGMEMEEKAVWEETSREYHKTIADLDALKERDAQIVAEQKDIVAQKATAEKRSPQALALEKRFDDLEKERGALVERYGTLLSQQAKVTHQMRSVSPAQTKKIDAIVSKMIPEGLTYSRESIQQCAAYVLSLPKENRDAALHRFELAMKRQEEAAAEQQMAIAKMAQSKQFERVTANLAEIRMGAIAYLRMPIIPKVETKPEGEPAKVGGAEVPKTVLPTAEKGWRAKKISYPQPTFDKWANMVMGEFQLGGQVEKEQLRPIWDEAVADFLYGASKVKLEELRTVFGLNWGKYRGDLPEPNTDPIVWEIQKTGKRPADFYRVAMSLGVDMRGPELGGPAGWEKTVEDYLLERKAQNDKELYARLHPESPDVIRKEGKLSFIKKGREPLTKEERKKAIDEYVKEQAFLQARRTRVISELHRRMVESSRVTGKSPLRKTISIGDIAFQHKAKGGMGSFALLNDIEGKNLDFLQALIPIKASGTAKETQRLLLLVGKNNDAELVSAFRSYPEHELMVYNPKGKPGDKTRKNIPISSILEDYTVKASILVTDPVRNFHQRWTGLPSATGYLRFMQEIGFKAAIQAGGGKAWRDLNIAQAVAKHKKAQQKQAERFDFSPEEAKEFQALKQKDSDSPESMTDKDRQRLKELYDLEEAVEKAKEERRRREEEEEGTEYEEETEAEAEPEPEARGEKELTSDQQHLVDWANAVDPDTIERRLSDPGFDPSDIETLPSKLAQDEWTLLRDIYLKTFISRPMSSIEADALGSVFNDYVIKEPMDIHRVLNDIQAVADTVDPLTGKKRGLRGQYFSMVSALNKMARKNYADIKANKEAVKEDFLDFCIENGLKPDHEAKVKHATELKISAVEQALFDAYELAQSSKRPAKGQVQPKVPYDLAAFRQKAMERYGDTARRDIEQLAISEEREITKGRAIRNITRRLGGINPEILKQYAAQLPPAKRQAALERLASTIQQPPVLGGFEWKSGRWVPIQGGVSAGKGLRTAPLPPELIGPPEAPLQPVSVIPPESLAPMPGMSRRWNPKTRKWEQVGKPVKVVEGPIQYTKRRIAGPGKQYERLVQEAPALEMTLSETEWGPSARAREEMRLQGRRGPMPEKPEPESLRDMIATGEQLFNTGSADPEAAMKRVETTGDLNVYDMSLIRFWGRELQRIADEVGRTRGYKNQDYTDAADMANEWANRITEFPAREAGRLLTMLRGNEDVDTGSVTFVRAAARKAKKGKELTPEEEAVAEERASDVEMAIEETKQSSDKLDKALDKPPPLEESQEKLVNKAMNDLDRILSQERMEYNKRHPKGAPMAMEGPEGRRPLSEEDLKFLEREGGNIRFRLSRDGQLSDATWREAMLAEHPEASGYLDRIHEGAIKFQNEFIEYTLGLDKATEPARKALTRKRPSLADSTIVVTRAMKMDPKGKRISHAEAYHMWNILKQKYMVPDQNGIRPEFDTMISRMAQDTGWDSERIYRAIASNKTTRKITKEMYDKMIRERRAIDQAKNWIKNLEYPGWQRWARKVPRVFFADKVLGHGFVGLITHAPSLMFNPWGLKPWLKAWAHMYKMVFSPEYHVRRMKQLQNEPYFKEWKEAGLQVDPFRYTDDYQITGLNKFLNKYAGGTGFDALKTLRYALAQQRWDMTPEALRTPEMRELWANDVNHATGIVKSSFPEWSNWAFFAPKLEGSRWAFLFKDTANAIRYLSSKDATPEQRFWAKSIIKQRAAVALAYWGLLAMNSAINKATDSDQEVNMWDPTKFDFGQFKVAGFKVGVAGPLLGVIRFLADAVTISHRERKKFDQTETRAESFFERSGEYAMGKASPFAQTASQIVFGHDFRGRPIPLPWRETDEVPAFRRRAGIEEYTPAEWLSTSVAPIPAEEVIREVWHDMGADQLTIGKFIRALSIGGIMGATGARVQPDPEVEE